MTTKVMLQADWSFFVRLANFWQDAKKKKMTTRSDLCMHMADALISPAVGGAMWGHNRLPDRLRCQKSTI